MLSYVVLRGRCRRCRARIPVREPVVEALGMAIGAGMVAVWGWSPSALLYGLLALGLLYVALVDLERMEVPWSGVLFLALLWAGAFVYKELHGWVVVSLSPLPGIAVMLGASAFGALVTRGRYGGGDWIIGALMGLYLGPYMALVAWFFANLFAVPLVFLGRREGRALPFAPALAAAAVIFTLPEIQSLWLHAFPYTF